jgi:hypothetical protein
MDDSFEVYSLSLFNAGLSHRSLKIEGERWKMAEFELFLRILSGENDDDN